MMGSWVCSVIVVLYFCKQKTAYEMLRSLVGSEMCIRDSLKSFGLEQPVVALEMQWGEL